MLRLRRKKIPVATSVSLLSLSVVVLAMACNKEGTSHGTSGPNEAGEAKPTFIDQALNPTGPDLSGLSRRITIAPDSTSQQGLAGYVGLLLEVDENAPPDKPPTLNSSRSIGKYRPNADQIQVDAQTGRTLYQGKITKGFSGGGNYLIFATSFSDDQAAEVTVKDEITVGFKEPRLIPYDRLAVEAKSIPRGKRRYFVSAATLTSVVHKDYKALKGEAQIAGTAFGANGKVFVSDENFQYQPVISLRLEDIGLLGPPTEERTADAAPSMVNSDAELLRRTTWKGTEVTRLSELLQRHSATRARKLLNNAVLRPEDGRG
jgi:hypothetical protein